MKNHRTLFAFSARPPLTSCSITVLAALGVLGGGNAAWAQSAGAGVSAGALPVLRGVVSGQAVVNSPVAGSGSRLMTIDQASPRAIIDWKSFNIGSDAEVRFNQPSATASALNRIYGNDPTTILGKLTANGQVLLINQNGILFGRGSQVNVQSLVASTLNITNERFNSGALSTGGLQTPAFEGGYNDKGETTPTRPGGSLPGGVTMGFVGNSTAAAPQLVAQPGGSILIFAPRIDNKDGLITAPDGQVILAAGGKAYLALADGTDATQRGFQVEIEATGSTSINLSDFIRNSGVISADRGNVTLAALAINQNGRVSANTAIQANGSVFLTARTKDGAQAGSVSFGAGSVTQVLPDTKDTATLAESQPLAASEAKDDRRGLIEVKGQTITSSGTLEAPGGRITLNASEATGVADATSARVYLDAGSVTSVAGSWSDVAYADNLLTFKVTSNELKDSPDQKLGVLKGATVTVDLRKGSPLLDLSGYVAGQKRTVVQKTATGGAIDIASSGSLIQRAGATLDASGGGYRYGAGTATTTTLFGADGKVYDISTADPQRQYTGLADSFTKPYTRWGQTEVFRGTDYGIGKSEAGYLEGKAGGSVVLKSAAGLVLDGALKGGVTVGPNQLASASRGGTLTIGQYRAATSNESDGFSESTRIGNVNFTQNAADTLGGTEFGANSALSAAQIDKLTLGAGQLFGKSAVGAGNTYIQNAFDSVEINSNGLVRVPQAVQIEGAPGSSLLLRAPQIDVAGSVTMPGGNITLQPVATTDPINADQGINNNRVTVRSTGALSTAGVWINNASIDGSFVGDVLPSARQNTVVEGTISRTTNSSTLSGGQLSIKTNNDNNSATVLERGALLNVGGGAALGSGRKLTAGDGGTLSIANGFFSTGLNADWLQADLSGLSFGNGGKLVLNTPRVVIDATNANGTLPANTTRLAPDLFSDHGFSSITVNTKQGIAVEAGAQIELRQKTRVLDSLTASRVATGSDLQAAATVMQLPASQRKPVNLALNASDDKTPTLGQATVTMAKGASIQADPGAAVSLSAVNALRVDGRITAPGGNVSLTLRGPTVANQTVAIPVAPNLTLGSTAAISVAGTFVPTPTTDGLVQGRVVDAGTITIAATETGVNLASGSQLDLSGIAQVVETRANNGTGAVLRQSVDGHAGALVIRSQGGVALGSKLHAAAGSPQGAGGAFALELNARDTEPTLPAERRIVVTQKSAPAGKATTADPAFNDAAIAIDTLQAAGFDKLRLQSENRIELRGDVEADFQRGIRLDAPLIEMTVDGRASLKGAAVGLGQSFDPRYDNGAAFTFNPQGTAPAVAARPGAGVLSVQAGTIDLFGSLALNGVSETRLFADDDIRLTGRLVNQAQRGTDDVGRTQVGSLTTTGNLTLSATQLYPSTRTDFTLSVAEQPGGTPLVGGSVTIASNGKTAGDVYSAGGRVALRADTIVQSGSVKAPLGDIDLHAGKRLELSPGSLTSVSANGLTLPLGTTLDGLNWRYNDGNSEVNPDSKRIGLAGATIDVRKGATVDLSGGGEVQALEFVKGIGGSKDTLLQPNTYAIIPKALLSSMPVDTATAATQDIGFGLQSKKYDTSVYDQLHIGRGAVVPEGDYVLLPGRYALLPGAYLVQLQTGSSYTNLQPGETTQLLNGQTVVAGWFGAAGTNVRASSTVGVVVRPGSAATRESDYTVTSSSYFTDLAASNRSAEQRVPVDAGRLVVSDTGSLGLAGTFMTKPGTGGTVTAPLTGRTAEVDISAAQIAVVDKVGSNKAIGADYLQLDGRSLSSLGSSLLLGGLRSNESDGVRITTQATDIVVANSASGVLSAAELLLAAKDSIEVRDGSVLTGRSASSTSSAAAASKTIKAEGGGALLRLSSSTLANVDRGSAIDNNTGTINIESGAVLNAAGSLLLDATRTLQSQGEFVVAKGGAASLASSKVSLGETANVADINDGLVLSNNNLAGLANLDKLTIKGYQGIDLFGNAKVGAASLGQLTLDSNAIRGRAVGTSKPAAQIAAREVRLQNSGSALTGDASAAAGALTIDAQRLVVEAGAQKINGYAAVAMNASSEMVGQGTGSLAVAGDWTVTTPKVGVAAGAVQTWQATDLRDLEKPVYSALKLAGAAGTAGTSTDSAAGGRLRLEGGSVNVATTVQARSGTVAIAALGAKTSDSVTLASGAVLDARGVSKDYNGHAVVANAGQVDLASANGAVTLATGSTVDVRGLGGGNAGSVRMASQLLGLGGTLTGTAEAGGTSGKMAIDTASLPDFSALNTALNAGGFNEARALRVRKGDLLVKADDVVNARLLSLSADAGRIDIKGQLNARSETGGAKIDVWADKGLALTGAQVLADGNGNRSDATAALSSGGQVRLATSSGTLDFDAASVIDVRPGAKGKTGNVTFTVARNSTHAIAPVQLKGRVLGVREGGNAGGKNGTAASVVVEAKRVYDVSGKIDNPKITGYANDHAAFIAAADAKAVLSGLKGDVSASLHGATELRTKGDLTIDTPWDLTTTKWLTNGQAGTLTLRAGGDLTVKTALGMPNDNLLAGDTWNLRLVGGSDLSAANPLATQALAAVATDKGHVLISTDSGTVRTGTGAIEIAAAADFRMDALKSVVYTAGKIGVADVANVPGKPATEAAPATAAINYDRWAQDGGSISITAGRDATGQSDEWITEWLRRPRGSAATATSAATPAEWWAYRPNFQQGVGTLGGGDISVTAGRDVNGLSALLPTTGRSVLQADGSRTLDVQGGGNLKLQAGNDVQGGSYLVARGKGSIEASGNVGLAAPTQLFLMGVSSGAVPEQATVSLSAGKGIALQSVNNPTAMLQTASTGSGPSFGAGRNSVATFFSYSADSGVNLLAKSGDVAIGRSMSVGRGLGATKEVADSTQFGAFPATLAAAAFNGDIALGKFELPADLQPSDPIVTFPSPTASVMLLAEGALRNPNIKVSDLSPTEVASAAKPSFINVPLQGDVLESRGLQGRITERPTVEGYRFDFQARTGDVIGTGAGAAALEVPAATRIRAGRDIKNVGLTLQNLSASDVSEVRADTGDVRTVGVEIRGPGALLVQAGRDIDLGQGNVVIGSDKLGGLIATASNANPRLTNTDAAQLFVVAGVKGNIDLAGFKVAYDALVDLNGSSEQVLAFYRALNGDTDRNAVSSAAGVQDLVARDKAYAPYADLVTRYPGVLQAYQAAAKSGSLPLGTSTETAQAAALYALLNQESDAAKIVAAKSVADLVQGTQGGAAYAAYAALDTKYPRVFADYRARRGRGALPEGLTPILVSDALASVVARVVPPDSVSGGNIFTFQNSIQTYGNGNPADAKCVGQCAGQGDVNLWAPKGNILAGLTTPAVGTTVGVVTNGGGAIRSALSGDFTINQGKVLTAQGGDILIFSSGASIDAGRGAKTSVSTPPPTRTPITTTVTIGEGPDAVQETVVVGYRYTLPASASGSGIQTLSSDPDGLGPLTAPKAGSIFLFAPAGTVDAGEAGIRSGGNIVVNAQTVLNSSNIAASGSSAGVPVATTGSLASSLATGGTTTTAAKSGDDVTSSATKAARAAEALQKPSILTVEVLGFGEKNCKEKDKDCFAK